MSEFNEGLGEFAGMLLVILLLAIFGVGLYTSIEWAIAHIHIDLEAK